MTDQELHQIVSDGKNIDNMWLSLLRVESEMIDLTVREKDMHTVYLVTDQGNRMGMSQNTMSFLQEYLDQIENFHRSLYLVIGDDDAIELLIAPSSTYSGFSMRLTLIIEGEIVESTEFYCSRPSWVTVWEAIRGEARLEVE